MDRRSTIASLAVMTALLVPLATSARTAVCSDFWERIDLLASIGNLRTSHPDYIAAVKALQSAANFAVESMPETSDAQLHAVAASQQSVAVAINNRDASDHFAESALLVFKAVGAAIETGRIPADTAELLNATITAAGRTATNAIRSADTAEHAAQLAFQRTLYATVCG